MREILFKAKDAKTKKWLEGFPVYFDAELGGEWYSCFIQTIRINYNGERRLGLLMPVIPETVCQYTGLTSKNGNKIWENDVVRKVDVTPLGWYRERIYKVSWDKEGYWLLTTTHGDGYLAAEFSGKQLERLGNIFDNPELLEGD